MLRVTADASSVPYYFHDVTTFFDVVRQFESGGHLYATDRPDYYDPGTPVYKYPPPYAAVLRFLLRYPRPAVIDAMLGVSLATLAWTFLVIARASRAPRDRVVLALVAWLNWQAFGESLQGLQLEPTLLLLVSLAAVAAERGCLFTGGMALGIATALKIYPAGLLLPFVVARRWRPLAGALAGFVTALGLSGLSVPLLLSVEYFTRILPRLGGTELAWDNLGLLSVTGRLALLLRSGPQAVWDAAQAPSTVLEHLPDAWLYPLALGLALALGIPLMRASVQALRNEAALGADGIGLACCLTLILLPTSWPDYHTLLALPLAWGILTTAHGETRTWACLLAAAVLGGLPSQSGVLEENRVLMALARTGVPLLLWEACRLRLGLQVTPSRLRASANGAGPRNDGAISLRWYG